MTAPTPIRSTVEEPSIGYRIGNWLAEGGPEILQAAQEPQNIALAAGAVIGVGSAGAITLRLGGGLLRKGLDATHRSPGDVLIGHRSESLRDYFTGSAVTARFEDRRKGYQVVAPTGQGKTTLFLRLLLEDVVAKHTTVLLETDGDLGQRLKPYVKALGMEDRFYHFDPTDASAMRFNPLKGNPERVVEQLSDTVASVMDNHHPYYAESDVEVMRHLTQAALDFARATGEEPTLLLVERLLTDDRFRREALDISVDPKTKEVECRAKFLDDRSKVYFEQIFETWRDRKEKVAGLRMLLKRLLSNQNVRRSLCTTKKGEPELNLGEALASGGLIVMRMPSNPLGAVTSQTLATLALQRIEQETLGRPEVMRRPLCFYMDEAHVVLGRHNSEAAKSFARWITQIRNFAVAVTLAYQSFDQLPEALKRILDSNLRNKLISGGHAAEDARHAQELLGYVEEVVEDVRESAGRGMLSPRRRSYGKRKAMRPRVSLEEIEGLPVGYWFHKPFVKDRQRPPTRIHTPRAESPGKLAARARAKQRREEKREKRRTGRGAPRNHSPKDGSPKSEASPKAPRPAIEGGGGRVKEESHRTRTNH